MRCKRARKKLGLMEGPDEWQTDPALAAHLKECGLCSEYGKELLLTWEALGRYPSVIPDPNFIATFNRRLAEQERRGRTRVSEASIPGWQWLALAASVLLVLLLTIKPPQPALDDKAGLTNADVDVTDENFLRDLDQSLERSESNYLPAYDSWPAADTESSPDAQPEIRSRDNARQKGCST